MKRFMLLHFGFEKPTPEIMADWQKWFASIADRQIDHYGFNGGREISRAGTRELRWDRESVTGCNIIEADSLDDAERIAKECPYISSIRVYEIKST